MRSIANFRQFETQLLRLAYSALLSTNQRLEHALRKVTGLLP